jgi:predicted  nucleic acid-binding Zn-ribbon protein
MRKKAVDMLSIAFKIKKIRDKNPNPDINEINYMQRYYKKCSDEFNRIRKNLRNAVDFNTDMDSIKLSVDQIDRGISEIR